MVLSLATDRAGIMSTLLPFFRDLGVNPRAPTQEMNMRSGLRFWSIALVAAALSSAAIAGTKSGQHVVLSTAGMYANGDSGYVHNSSDGDQYIFCRITGSTGNCYARNRDQVSRSCSTTNSTLVNTIRYIHGDSYIYFKWNEDGVCTSITVENGSMTRPKEH
jgi:hypothetical protein